MTIGPGSTESDTIVAIQLALIAAGMSVSPDGSYGGETQAAVAAFQGAHGLPTTGAVDSATAARLGVFLPDGSGSAEPSGAPGGGQNSSSGRFPTILLVSATALGLFLFFKK